MTRYVVRRIGATVPVLLGLSVIVFLFVRWVPGDAASAILGQHATPELVRQVHEVLGLDRPLHVQYLEYLGGLLRGDLGHSFITGRPVLSEFFVRFPGTLELAIAAMTIALVAGVWLGRFAGLHRGSWLDLAATVVSVGGISIPVFVLGFALVYVFAVSLRVLPGSGQVDGRLGLVAVTHMPVIDAIIAGRTDALIDALRHLVLPAIALSSIPFALITRQTRAAVIDVAGSDYVRTARAKGLPESRVIGRHIMRNAWLPVTTVAGLETGSLLAGAVIVETVFAWNGIGSWIVDAIKNHDYIVLQSTILIVGVIVLVTNLVVDIGYAYLNPRIRYG